MARSLIVLPDDSARPLLTAIGAARKSLRIKMFVFDEARLLNAVIRVSRRGVKVRVLLNSARRSGVRENESTRRQLERAGIDVREPGPPIDLLHEKSLVVDDATVFIQSLNWNSRNLTQTRDYAVVTTQRHDVSDVIDAFEADWHRQTYVPRDGTHLIWCPGGRDRVCRFIDAAKHRLWIQNERFQDMIVIDRLIRAARRGVSVAVMTRAPHTLKSDKLIEGVGGLRILDDAGIAVHKLHGLRLHGKVMVADEMAAIVGSINLSPGSFDRRRELAIEVHGDDILDRVTAVVHHDWKHSRRLDLSDEGLASDLEDRLEDSERLLALQPRHHGEYKDY